MTAVLGAAAVLLLLLLAVLLCPVRYRCRADRQGGMAEVSLLGGLYRKRMAWPEPEEVPAAETEEGNASDESEPETPQPMEAETPLLLDGEGYPAEEPLPAETEAQDEETKKPGALAVLSFAWDNGTIGIVLRAAGKLYRHSRPRKLRLSGRAGLGDPMQTGVLAGLLYAALPGASDITWDYTGRCFDVTAEAEGRVVPLYILYILGGVLASGPVRRTRAYLKGRSPQISPETA